MKNYFRHWPNGPLQVTGVALLTVILSACGAGGQSSSSEETSSSFSSASSSSAGSMAGTHDSCIEGFMPQATDATMRDGYAEYTEFGQTDATVQPEVINWMDANVWQESHFLWHSARRCGGGGFGGFGSVGGVDPCSFPEMRPEQNECAGPQDGYEFLVMHRHMIHALKELWPNHTEQFTGWNKFPGREDYPDILRQYYNNWSSSVLQDAALADGINQMSRAQVLAKWPTEGHFGQWIQCGSLQGGIGLNGLHGALHFNGYPMNNQSHSVANQHRNLDAYLFWKLHGWIDSVWEKYRTATGLTPDEPKLQAELIAQCQEHHFWAEKLDPSLAIPTTPVAGSNDEAGVFHEIVRPALERAGCATCHGAGEMAGLRLGYQVTSAEIVRRLVNMDARNVENYKLVVPGDPDRSWLYLKASGNSQFTNAVCRASAITTCKQPMPNSDSAGMTSQELNALRQWILDGAEAPTQL